MAQCMYCGGSGGCLPGCDGPCCGGGSGGSKKSRPGKPGRHAHAWVWKRRTKPIDGSRPYDVYGCSYPGCPAIDERKV